MSYCGYGPTAVSLFVSSTLNTADADLLRQGLSGNPSTHELHNDRLVSQWFGTLVCALHPLDIPRQKRIGAAESPCSLPTDIDCSLG